MCLLEKFTIGNPSPIRSTHGLITLQLDIEVLVKLKSSCWQSHKLQIFAGEFLPRNPNVRAFEITASNPIQSFVKQHGLDIVHHIWRFQIDHMVDLGFVLAGVLMMDGAVQSMGWIPEPAGKPKLAEALAKTLTSVKYHLGHFSFVVLSATRSKPTLRKFPRNRRVQQVNLKEQWMRPSNCGLTCTLTTSMYPQRHFLSRIKAEADRTPDDMWSALKVAVDDT